MSMQLHKEGQHEIEDADFLREMGIGCEDNGLQLTQLSERTANIDCQQVCKKGNLFTFDIFFVIALCH